MAAPEHLSAALDIHLAWGPERAIPVQDRFRAKLPPMPDADLAWLEAQCDAIFSMACGLADAIGFQGLSPHEAPKRLKAKWPTLDDERIGRVMHQGYYSFWRDNGRSPEERPAPKRPPPKRPPPKRAPRPKSAKPRSRRAAKRGA